MRNLFEIDAWKIIENKFDSSKQKQAESIFSIGNGSFGQRANFEEDYGGKQLTGNYISGVYFKDRTKVSWWKNGYPDYFAKMVNCPNWNRLRIFVNDQLLDLDSCKEISFFIRELNMKEGWLSRSFEAILQNGIKIKVDTKRFLRLELDAVGAINYNVTPINAAAKITYIPYLDAGISNEDTNWDDQFWDVLKIDQNKKQSFIVSLIPIWVVFVTLLMFRVYS